jgi:DNA primase
LTGLAAIRTRKPQKPKKYGRYVASDYDIEDVMTRLLGEPQGRPGASGSWWRCPLCSDQNPSLTVDPNRNIWHCFACGKPEKGSLDQGPIGAVKAIRGLDFLRAKDWLEGRGEGGGTVVPRKVNRPPRVLVRKGSILSPRLAEQLAPYTRQRLWTDAGREDLDYLRGRGLRDETLKSVVVGSYGGVLETGDLEGVAINWIHEGALVMIKVRRRASLPGPNRYLIVYKNTSKGPVLYPGYSVGLRPGSPVIITEGEIDCISIWQELDRKVRVCTLGSASEPITPAVVEYLSPAGRLYIGTDRGQAGDIAAAKWTAAFPDRSIRILPPGNYKDWNECLIAGVDLAAFWRPVLAG